MNQRGLECKIHDIELASPISVASSHLTGNPAAIAKAFGLRRGEGGLFTANSDSRLVQKNATAGFVSVKTTTGKSARGNHATANMIEAERHRIALLKDGRDISALNCETSYPHDFATYLEMLEEALQMGKPLMISVGYETEEIKKTIGEIKKVAEKYPSCPIMFELSLHHAKDDKTIKDRIKTAVQAAGDHPVFVKISYYGGDYLRIAKMAVEECGARGIVGINSLGPFDANHTLAKGESGWLSGRLISNTSLEICRQITETICGPNGIPYVAVGGVDPKNIEQYFRAGAHAVQTCTYLMAIGIENGLLALTKALQTALQRAKATSVDEIRGVTSTARQIELEDELNRLKTEVARLAGSEPPQKVADLVGEQLTVDGEKCTGCGVCADACSETAILIRSRIAEIDKAKCEECGACAGTCKPGAIKWE